ncbi:hypothetical protein [Oerskovia sp. Root918]|uniref:hypothetical protein n=1 Tax=Oerskovia sp. Root918 TaxID=1736607 RepID=UPI003516B771
MSNGATTLAAGNAALAEGAGTLHTGTTTLADGAGDLAEGSSTLADGAGTLADGTVEISNGTAKLKSDVENSPAGKLSMGASAILGGGLLAGVFGVGLGMRRRLTI